MGDVLKYRIPNEKVYSKTGKFEVLPDGIRPRGFVLTTFQGEICYQFKESTEESEQFSFSKQDLETSKTSYENSARLLIERLKSTGGKAILSRIKSHKQSVDPNLFFSELCETYPNAFVYLISSPFFGTWIGATPETLVERKGLVGKTMALAGTRKSESDKAWTEKEFEEHELVADFIEKSAERSQLNSITRSKREVIQSGPVKHLLTRFQFELNENQDWDFAKELHPTPAVSGFPRDQAFRLISEIESHERSLYAGIIGLIESETNLYVNLRCAQIAENEVFLYLGGGFTKDSVVEDEWQETENKAKTLLNVLKKQ